MTKKTSAARTSISWSEHLRDAQATKDYVKAQDQTSVADGVCGGEPDYHEVSYLRQGSPEAPWTAHTELFPTRDEATDRAFSLNASGHKALRVSPRYWGK